MTEQDRQLVELITQQVLAILQQRGALGGDASPPVAPPVASSPTASPPGANPSSHNAPIQPPIGICTGDYSQFPELRGKLYGNNPSASRPSPTQPSPAQSSRNAPSHSPMPPAAQQPPAAHQPLALTGIVTANQLQQAIDATTDGVAHLAPDARLTPLASDLARQHPEKICRHTPGAPQPAGLNHPQNQQNPATLPWLWWIEGQCGGVRDVTRTLGGWLRPIAAGPHAAALPQVVRELASAIKGRQVAGGVLFVPNAARAMCYLNRCAAVRAVVGTCGEAVEQGIAAIGANVLVIEYPHHGARAMTAMAQRMLQQPPAAPPAVERDLADLHRC